MGEIQTYLSNSGELIGRCFIIIKFWFIWGFKTNSDNNDFEEIDV